MAGLSASPKFLREFVPGTSSFVWMRGRVVGQGDRGVAHLGSRPIEMESAASVLRPPRGLRTPVPSSTPQAARSATADTPTLMPHPTPQLARYQQWLADTHHLHFDSYDALWQWSITDLNAFWQSIWDWFDIQSPTPHRCVLESAVMPGAIWFPGAQLNYTQQVLRHADAAHAAGHPAIVFQNERMAAPESLSWPELRRQVAAFARRLQAAGVHPGDRVCAILPNAPQTVVAFLACAGIGAVWSVCSPDMGPVAILDRFSQIEPVVLVACDGQVWGGSAHDRRGVLRQVLDGLPSVRQVVFWADVDPTASEADFHAPHRQSDTFADWAAAGKGGAADDAWRPAWLPFDHPLWIVYSSGTTGLPKAIVHGHGGIVLELLKGAGLHNDIAPSVQPGERFHWFSSTGWIMWNAQVGGLLSGTTICLYDGNPGGPSKAPDWGTLWRFAAAAGVTWFGAGAAFFASCLKAGVQPMAQADLSRLRAIGSTGSPLSEDAYRWIWDHLPKVDGADIWLAPISGGTDFAGAFVAGNRLLPVTVGEMQCRCLGAAIHAFDEQGQALIDAVGELVCTQPMPSMPLRFWNDPGGERYRDSYFDMYPGIWRHGDWLRITPHPESGSHGAVIYGRSDATINRHGIRMGTSELYRAVEALPEVLDSLVVDLEYLGQPSNMPLFVVLREGMVLDEALTQRLRLAVREALSPRHVPDEIHQVAAIPRTLSGKKMELPVKKLLQGAAPDAVFNRDAMAAPDSVAWFSAFAAQRLQATAPTGGKQR
ncbi:MAG: acetoacetate--CoA ligase [Rubrivivax sp.]